MHFKARAIDLVKPRKCLLASFIVFHLTVFISQYLSLFFYLYISIYYHSFCLYLSLSVSSSVSLPPINCACITKSFYAFLCLSHSVFFFLSFSYTFILSVVLSCCSLSLFYIFCTQSVSHILSIPPSHSVYLSLRPYALNISECFSLFLTLSVFRFHTFSLSLFLPSMSRFLERSKEIFRLVRKAIG